MDCKVRTDCNARTEPGVVGPCGQICRKKIRKEGSRSKTPVGCKARMEVGTVGPLVQIRPQKDENHESRGTDASTRKARQGFDFGGVPFGGRYNQTRRKRVKRNQPVGRGASMALIAWDL